jgi:uncharacterized RDD family membrane protein YckC
MPAGTTETRGMSYLEGPIGVETPENVVFYHRMGGISTRAVAVLLDTIFQIAAIIVIVFVSVAVSAVLGSVQTILGFFPVDYIWAIMIFLIWVALTGYYVLFEAFWSGQTPAKRILRIRVIKDNGGPIGFYEALLRNLLRMVDALPSAYGAGFITALITKREQRLGDLVAGTMVVQEATATFSDRDRMRREVSDDGKEVERILGLNRLEEEDFILARDFLERRKQLAAGPRGELAVSIATAVAKKMAFYPPKPMPAEWFLEAILWQAAELEEPEVAVEGGNEDVWKEVLAEGEDSGAASAPPASGEPSS